ncbi:hypothetical protein CC1G_03074 [Coprinopsis cinerea okayama7|uniref:XPG-I domain-containing protein n=1 Tax=Coprinopsis cinerea (strain Okayama-7 / 130 / ATCC MYA-4618 / FGSC 9003) TaxID=240176 RepID=A8PEU2_COPC7|nr:hypothetical protein CC1G_03074 [Coprinopsis cinerea okayama7\|eukprot:XP_001840845.1 hypothetical protein CC1G_03074 [Coprinopsis cinerea okayama7\
MGVAGLWEVLRPAAKPRSLTELSVTEGFQQNPEGVRGYRLGIDASIWFFHAEYGREGENPVLRTLFFRCATLMKSPFLPLFVFDGPKRPDWKRGRKINKTPSKLIPGMKQIVEAFGFEHRTAPGEAEAELAYLNRIGAIDGILSDDVDNFLFGATAVIRNPSNTLSGNRSNPILNAAGKDDKNHSWVFKMSDITTHPQVGLTRGGLILIGLLSGGDYHQSGVERCGIKTAVALAKCGFGDTLYQAATNLTKDQLPDFLDNWRHELRHEVATNSRGLIGRKSPALAKCITDAFPDIDVLLSYVNPITSESMGRPYSPRDIRWNKEPDIAKLAYTCEFYFEWGYKEAIIKRFRTVIWHSAVLRILRRAVLDLDEGMRSGPAIPSTPSRQRIAEDACGTPSKMITKYFSSMGLDDRHDRSDGSDGEEEDERLILKIHSMREHASTDGLLEYRLEVNPGQLVRMAESGIQGLRQPEGPDEWASEDDGDEEGGGKGSKAPVDPYSHMRLWMPACMVKLVEPRLVREFEEEAERKRLKKANKGQGRKKKTTTADDSGSSPPKRKRVTKKKAAPLPSSDGEEEDDALPVPKPKAKATKSTAVPLALSSDSDSEGELPSPSKLFSNAKPSTSKVPTASYDENDVFSAPSPLRRAGVKDLTKKKGPSSTLDVHSGTTATLTAFFPLTKPSAKANATAKSNLTACPGPSTSKARTNDGSSHRAPAPFPLSFDDFGGMDNPITDDVFASSPPPTLSKARSYRERSTSASSSTSQSRVNKSPRKSRSQRSPTGKSASASTSARSESPTPLHTSMKDPSSRVLVSNNRPPNGKAVVEFKNLPVIEISSSEDEEDEPARPPAPRLQPAKAIRPKERESAGTVAGTGSARSGNKSGKEESVVEAVRPSTPPLLRARARARAKPTNVVAVIDLT